MRCVRWSLFAGLGTLAVMLLASQSGSAEEQLLNEHLKVSATATRPDAQGRQTVTVHFAIDPGWYIYANPVGTSNELFKNLPTLIRIRAASQPGVRVLYPAGVEHKDKNFGTYLIYQGKLSIQALVQRAAGDTSALTVDVKANTCHVEGKCVATKQALFTLP